MRQAQRTAGKNRRMEREDGRAGHHPPPTRRPPKLSLRYSYTCSKLRSSESLLSVDRTCNREGSCCCSTLSCLTRVQTVVVLHSRDRADIRRRRNVVDVHYGTLAGRLRRGLASAFTQRTGQRVLRFAKWHPAVHGTTPSGMCSAELLKSPFPQHRHVRRFLGEILHVLRVRESRASGSSCT